MYKLFNHLENVSNKGINCLQEIFNYTINIHDPYFIFKSFINDNNNNNDDDDDDVMMMMMIIITPIYSLRYDTSTGIPIFCHE